VLTLPTVLRSSARYDAHGIVLLPAQAMSALGLLDGDVVVLRAGRATGAIALTAPAGSPAGGVLCDELLLANLQAAPGDQVDVTQAPRTEADRVHVTAPDGVRVALEPAALRTALLGKVVTAGDAVSLRPSDLAPAGDPVRLRSALGASLGAGWTAQRLTVTATEPPGPVLVTMGSVVGWQGGPAPAAAPVASAVERRPAGGTDGEPAVRTLADLPGLESQGAALQEWLELGFHHADLLVRLGARPGMGVLVTGPSGSGKAALVEAVAASVGAELLVLDGPQLAATEPTAARDLLHETLARATRSSPAVVLLADVQAVAPREGAGPLLPALLAAVREAVAAGRVAVVCTTSHPERVTPQLRTPGTLDHELAVPLPDRRTRLRQLEVATRSLPLAEDVALDEVAGRTPGFVAEDLLALVREAGLRAAARQRDSAAPTLAQADLVGALEVVRATSMEGSTLDLSPLTLDDVGDMADVKQALTEAVLWPLTYPDTFARLGVDPPRGLLLYGPPGCGKTFLVKAIAGSGQANVLSVKGAELLTKWVGESERAVRELFRRARESAPAIVFLDEVDALAPVRGQSTDGGTTDRVVASLLTELDGVEALRDVVVIAATNRPDLVDPALLRPGRLERLVFAPPPDADARTAILRAASSGVPLADDVDLADLGQRTDGFSGADCTALVREAALTAMRASMSAATVTAEHVEAALRAVRPSLDPAQVAHLAAYAERRAAR
jgi:transitional endoplasmic reticulum ATPase